MSRPVRRVLILLAIFLVSAPLSVVATIFLFPFWAWFEATTGIESVGHSGPAEWCYLAAFLVLVTGATLALLGRRRGERHGGKTA